MILQRKRVCSTCPLCLAATALQAPVVNMVRIHDVFLNRASDPASVPRRIAISPQPCQERVGHL